MELLHKDLTDKIIKAFFNVYSELGYGFLEKVYENALCHELSLQGLSYDKQKPIKVSYKEQVVGEYFADILVEDTVILELKATEMEVGFLLSFGKNPKFVRKVFENKNK